MTDLEQRLTERLRRRDDTIESLQSDRDAWMCMVGRICEAIPLNDTLKATTTLGNLIEYLKDRLQSKETK